MGLSIHDCLSKKKSVEATCETLYSMVMMTMMMMRGIESSTSLFSIRVYHRSGPRGTDLRGVGRSYDGDMNKLIDKLVFMLGVLWCGPSQGMKVGMRVVLEF